MREQGTMGPSARWTPGDRWAVPPAEPLRDWTGYAYPVVALAIAALVVAPAPAFVVVVPDLLAVAVERR